MSFCTKILLPICNRFVTIFLLTEHRVDDIIYTEREKTEDKKMTINNMPNATEKYIVARRVDGDLWFWGSYADRDRANEVALEIGGEVIAAD